MTCQCCLQATETATCDLCGWQQDKLDARGFSRANRTTVGKARVAFMRSLPARLDAAIRACAPVSQRT